MKKFFKQLISSVLWRDRLFVTLTSIGAAGLLASWLLSAQVEFGQEVISWHYTVYFGIDRVGPWWMALTYAGFATIVFVINFLLGAHLYYSRKLASYIVMFINVLIQVFTVMQISALLYFII